MILEVDGQPLGFANLGPCDDAGSISWGFYAAPGAPAGTGRQLGEAALDYAFNTLGVRQVRGEVLEHNSASLAFHCKLGFSQAGEPIERQLPSGRRVRVIDFVLESEKFTKRPDSP
jgi:RimJ/RimL family protein N-acetyltransferase